MTVALKPRGRRPIPIALRARRIPELLLSFLPAAASVLVKLFFIVPYPVCCSNDANNYIFQANPSFSSSAFNMPAPTQLFGEPLVFLFGLKYGIIGAIIISSSFLAISSYFLMRLFASREIALLCSVLGAVMYPTNALTIYNALDSYLGVGFWILDLRYALLAIETKRRSDYYLLGALLGLTATFSPSSFIIAFLSLALLLLSKKSASSVKLAVRNFVKYSLPTAIIVLIYGLFYWTGQIMTAGQGITNSPNGSPFNVATIIDVVGWTALTYSPIEVWGILLPFSLAYSIWESVYQKRAVDLAIFVSVILGVFTALIPYPFRISYYLWVPVLLTLCRFLDRFWRGSYQLVHVR